MSGVLLLPLERAHRFANNNPPSLKPRVLKQPGVMESVVQDEPDWRGATGWESLGGQ